jgi:hypothetical protein
VLSGLHPFYSAGLVFATSFGAATSSAWQRCYVTAVAAAMLLTMCAGK